MAIANWALLRQIEALRVAMATALQFGTIAQGKRVVEDDEVRDWLRAQGLECDDESPPFILALLSLDQLKQPWGMEIVQSGRRSAQDAEDIGRERSGADFQDQSDFVITSALLRLLGAQEQFERDTLKCLLYYRPLGKSCDVTEYEHESVDELIVAEPGTKEGDKLVFEKPSLWTWISKPAENNVERHKIFSNVFGIKCLPDKKSRATSTRLYDIRNQIAHGRAGVKMTVAEYRDAEYHVIACMRHLGDECKNKYRLEL